jgi:signal transduction histidine kinase
MKYFFVIIVLLQSIFSVAQSNNALLLQFKNLDSMFDAVAENHADQAMKFALQQIKIANMLQNDSLFIVANKKKAMAYAYLGIFDECLQTCYNITSFVETKKRIKELGELYYYIGATYFAMHDFPRYLTFNQKARQAFITAKQYKDTAKANAEIGLAYVGLGEHQRGITLLEKNIETLRNADDEEFLVTAIDNLSNCYAETDDYTNALKYQLQLLPFKITNSSLLYKASVNQHLAEIYVHLKDYTNAQKHVDIAIKYSVEMKSNDWLFECYKNQAAIYEGTGNYKQALDYHQKYVETKDSVYQKNYDSKMSAMANLYELDTKQNAIANLEKDQLLSSAKIQRLYLIIASLLLLLIVIILLINHKKNKNEKILRQQFSEQLLQTQETERQRISKDLHDSVGQNLLFIKNQVQKLFANENPTLSKSVDVALEEVRNISKDLYPNQLEQYGLLSAIDGLCQKVKESTNIFVSTEIEYPNENLSKDKKINCYRIVQECINNIIKHASASAIRITGQLINNQLQLTIQDNGIGFEKSSLDAKANRSFGMLNLQERVRILNGKFELETALGKGTKSIFFIPIY